MITMPILEVTNVKKTYTARIGAARVEALKNVTFTAERGEYIAIMGESGSGKTTLLNILAALDKPTGGKVILDFNLLDTFTVRDNILLPLVLMGMSYGEMEKKLLPAAEKLGISALLDKYPYEISGGQKQRTAAARAMITEPKLLLADEPTGALDSKASDELLAVFSKLNSEGQTILMVTHSVKAASHANRVLFIKDGEVFHQLYRGGCGNEEFYKKISDTLTLIASGGAV